MARPKASQCALGVPEPSKHGQRKETSKTPSPQVLGISNLIVLDSEDESEETTVKPFQSKLGCSRDLGKAAVSLVDTKPVLSPPISSDSRKMKDSRKRVLAVEDPSGACMFDSRCLQASPSAPKRSTPGAPLDGKCHLSDTKVTVGPLVVVDARKTVGPAVEWDTLEQSAKAKRKRKDGVKAEMQMQSGTPERAEQDNKENNGSDVLGENGVNNENGGKKRKKEADSSAVPESSSKPSDVSAGGSVPSEEKIVTTCHQCRQRLHTSLARCRNMDGKRVCTHKYCAKCLCNRYGELVAEVEARDSWSCPRCRGICNCSLCM